MSLWSRLRNALHKPFEYPDRPHPKAIRQSPNRPIVQPGRGMEKRRREFERKNRPTPRRKDVTIGNSAGLWNTDTLDQEQLDLIESPEIQAMYQTAWVDKRISYRQRRNARDALVDLFAAEGMNFTDVFDYEEWRQRYDNAAA